MLPKRVDPFIAPSRAERRRLITTTVLLVCAWIVAGAAFLVSLDKVFGPMEHAVVKLDKPRGSG